MKKIFTFWIFAIVFAILSSTVSADNAPVIYGDVIECKSGEMVKFSVNISNNPGIAGFLISSTCEDDWLYFSEESEKGNVASSGTIVSSREPQLMNTLWVNTDNVLSDGELFSFDVHISPSAPSGDYPINIAVSEENTINDNSEQVKFEVRNGCITVEHVDRLAEEMVSTSSSDSANDNSNVLVWAAGGIVVICSVVVVCCIAAKRNKNSH